MTASIPALPGMLGNAWTSTIAMINSGAWYTRFRRPVNLVYKEAAASRSIAARREFEIKRLSKQEKESLVTEFK